MTVRLRCVTARARDPRQEWGWCRPLRGVEPEIGAERRHRGRADPSDAPIHVVERTKRRHPSLRHDRADERRAHPRQRAQDFGTDGVRVDPQYRGTPVRPASWRRDREKSHRTAGRAEQEQTPRRDVPPPETTRRQATHLPLRPSGAPPRAESIPQLPTILRRSGGRLKGRVGQSTPAVISARALMKTSISSAVVNGPGLSRSVPSGKVPRARWM